MESANSGLQRDRRLASATALVRRPLRSMFDASWRALSADAKFDRGDPGCAAAECLRNGYALSSLASETARASWRLTLRGNGAFTNEASGIARSLILSHWYHHRGQLSVYLRLLDVRIPVIDGRSADQNPFA